MKPINCPTSLATVVSRHVGGQRTSTTVYAFARSASVKLCALKSDCFCTRSVYEKMTGLVPQYSSTMADEASKKRYTEKLELVDGIDPYEYRYSNPRKVRLRRLEYLWYEVADVVTTWTCGQQSHNFRCVCTSS